MNHVFDMAKLRSWRYCGVGILSVVIISIYFFFLDRRYFAYGLSEFFISYSNGFTRRGLPGSILEFIDRTGVPSIDFLLVLIFVTYCFNFFLLYAIIYLVSNDRKRIKYVVFIPTLLMFPALDFNALVRKDVFIINLLLLHKTIFLFKIQEKISLSFHFKCLYCLLLPYAFILALSHEFSLLFLPIHLLLARKSGVLSVKRGPQRAVLDFAIALGAISVLVLTYHSLLEPTSYDYIIKDLQRIGLRDFTALDAMSQPQYVQFQWTLKVINSGTWVIYLAFLSLTFVALLRFTQVRLRQLKTKSFVISFAPLTLLFLASDWGRWVHLLSYGLLVFLLLLRPNKDTLFSGWDRFLICAVVLRLPHCCADFSWNLLAPVYFANEFLFWV